MSEDFAEDNSSKRCRKQISKRKAIMNMALPESEEEMRNDLLIF